MKRAKAAEEKNGHQGHARPEQRSPVAFTGAAIAVAVILLITLWEYLF
jgi:hypothetical protein